MIGEELLKKIAVTRLVPVFYHDDIEITTKVVKTCYDAGIRAFEFTNRGANAKTVMSELIKIKPDDLAMGIGTIMNKTDCQVFLDLGVDFIVSPVLDIDTANLCRDTNISWTPGCGTLSEIIHGVNLGASLVKIFPGGTMGSGFVKSVLGPCPYLNIMPTGGVSSDAENLIQWFDSGVFCVGMGSKLFTNEIIKFGKWEELMVRLKAIIGLIRANAK